MSVVIDDVWHTKQTHCQLCLSLPNSRSFNPHAHYLKCKATMMKHSIKQGASRLHSAAPCKVLYNKVYMVSHDGNQAEVGHGWSWQQPSVVNRLSVCSNMYTSEMPHTTSREQHKGHQVLPII